MPEQGAEIPQRTLHFPQGYEGGWLVVLVGEGKDKHVFSRPRVAPQVSVPEDAEVHFQFRPFRRVDWSGLAELRSDDLSLLDASSAPIEDSDLAYLERLTGLRWLDPGDTSITDNGLRHVAVLTNLEMLHLGSTRISNGGLGHLRRLRSIRQLHLRATRIDDAGLIHLVELPVLEALSLYATEVSDTGLVHVVRMRRLRYIALQATAVTASGISRLQEALPECRILLHWEDEGGKSDLTEENLALFPYAERAREANEAGLTVHEAARVRDYKHPETIAAWHAAIDEGHRSLLRAYPPGFWELVGLLRYGDPRGLEQAIRFLEADPWFFRSGYTKDTSCAASDVCNCRPSRWLGSRVLSLPWCKHGIDENFGTTAPFPGRSRHLDSAIASPCCSSIRMRVCGDGPNGC
jgi:hypothetical protein